MFVEEYSNIIQYWTNQHKRYEKLEMKIDTFYWLTYKIHYAKSFDRWASGPYGIQTLLISWAQCFGVRNCAWNLIPLGGELSHQYNSLYCGWNNFDRSLLLGRVTIDALNKENNGLSRYYRSSWEKKKKPRWSDGLFSLIFACHLEFENATTNNDASAKNEQMIWWHWLKE